MAGLTLDPWQQLDVIDILGVGADGMWAAFEAATIVARQNGKGGELEAIELAGLFLFGEKLIIHTAHEFKTAAEAYLRVKQLIVDTPELNKRVRKFSDAHGEEGISLRSGARLRFLARSKGSGRGFSCDRLIYDEAYDLPAANVAASLPTLSARPNPQIIYTSSAPLDNSETLKAIRARGHRKPGTDWDSLCYLEYSADPRGYDVDPKTGKPTGLDLDDRRGWHHGNPALGYRIREKFIANERATMTDIDFARERLGIVDEVAINAVLRPEKWETLRSPLSTPRDPIIVAFDTNPDSSWSSIGIAGRRLDGRSHVELVRRERNMSWMVDALIELSEDWEPKAIYVDAMSPATALIPTLAENGVEVIVTNTSEYGRACQLFVNNYEDDKLRHIGQAPLTTATESGTKRIISEGGAWAWARKDKADISPLVAVTLANYGLSKSLDKTEEEEEVDTKVVIHRGGRRRR